MRPRQSEAELEKAKAENFCPHCKGTKVEPNILPDFPGDRSRNDLPQTRCYCLQCDGKGTKVAFLEKMCGELAKALERLVGDSVGCKVLASYEQYLKQAAEILKDKLK